MAQEVRNDGKDSQPATWAEAILAARAALPAVQFPDGVEATPWWTTGAISAEGLEESFPCERKFDLGDKHADGRPVWRQRTDWGDGRSLTLDVESRGVVYLARIVRTGKRRNLNVDLNYNTAVELRLNGTLVEPDKKKQYSLKLQEGENQLLLKLWSKKEVRFAFSTGDDHYAHAEQAVAERFPTEAIWFSQHADRGRNRYNWFSQPDTVDVERKLIAGVLESLGPLRAEYAAREQQLVKDKTSPDDPRWLGLFVDACRARQQVFAYRRLTFAALERALDDLETTFPDRYPKQSDFRLRLGALRRRFEPLRLEVEAGNAETLPKAIELVEPFVQLQREALVANPLLDFDRLLVLRRDFDGTAREVMSAALGMPSLNSHTHDTIRRTGWHNEIAVLSDLRGQGRLATLWKPASDYIVSDIDLHFDGRRIAFSSTDDGKAW